MRIRAAAYIEIDGKIALMHRLNVKKIEGTNRPFGEYYVFPGGGMEEDDASIEDAVKREVLEEFGIEVLVKEKIFYRKVNEENEEYIFNCEYISGEFGTGTGPEFSHDPKYADRGEYIPILVRKEELKNINLIPKEFKDRLIENK